MEVGRILNMSNIEHTLLISLARSGYHAIAEWIGDNHPNTTLFHNNVNQYLWPRRVELYGEKEDPVYNYIYSLENFDITGYEETFGHIPFDNTLLVVRDPYNWLASSLAKGGSLARVEETFEPSELPYNQYFCQSMPRLDMYKTYMREVKGQTSLLPEDTIVVNYNRWVTEDAYRAELARNLGLESWSKLPSMPNYGGGSSFSEFKHVDNPEELDVLNRWYCFRDNKYYWSLIDDEMREFSRKYFDLTVEEEE